MSNFIYLANGDVLNINIKYFNKIEHFTNVSDNTIQPIMTSTIMTPEMKTEQQRLDDTLLRSQNMEFELNTSIQNINETANQLILNLTRN
jgi:hypothetical protein